MTRDGQHDLKSNGCERVILGAGCFWYLQHLIEPTPGSPAFPGVLSTEVGYAGKTNEEIELEACGCSLQEVVDVRFAAVDGGAMSELHELADPLARRLQGPL